MTKIDSRIVKTQEKLFDAYLRLLEQKAPEQIFVQELTIAAQIHHGQTRIVCQKNNLATALRKIGRIEKIMFILNNILDEALRREI